MNVLVSVAGWLLWGYVVWNARAAIRRDLARLPWGLLWWRPWRPLSRMGKQKGAIL
jgi:hypothetical protein